MHSSENVYFELFLLQKYVGVVCYLLKFIWQADIFSLCCIAIKSEKWIYTTISEKLTNFHDSYKHLHFEKRVGATIHEQQHSYKCARKIKVKELHTENKNLSSNICISCFNQ